MKMMTYVYLCDFVRNIFSSKLFDTLLEFELTKSLFELELVLLLMKLALMLQFAEVFNLFFCELILMLLFFWIVKIISVHLKFTTS